MTTMDEKFNALCNLPFSELLIKLKDTGLIFSPGEIMLEEKYWNDELLENHYVCNLKPLEEIDFVNTSIYFWKGYLGGDMNPVAKVVRLALEMGCIEDGKIVPYFHDSVLDINVKDKPTIDELVLENDGSILDCIPDELFHEIRRNSSTSNHGLDCMSSKDVQNSDRFIMWYKGLTQPQRKVMTSCTCLVLLRCIVMSPDSVTANIRTSLHENLTKWCGLPKSKGEFFCPADKYVASLRMGIAPFSRLCQFFVSRILKAYKKCLTAPFLDPNLEAIYKQMFLQHTFCYGMKVIDLLSSLTKKGHKWEELIERLPESSHPVEPLKLFLEKYFTTNNPNHSLVFWCRMLDQSYHCKLKGKRQAIFLAHLVAIQQPNLQANIWKMKALDSINKSMRERIVWRQKEITKRMA